MSKIPRKSAAAAQRRGVQSAEVALRVAAVLAAHARPQGLKAIAAGAGLEPSAAHRYLASLMRSGLVVQDEASGYYDLGPFALRLGYAALARHRPIVAVERAMERYVAATGQTATASVWTEHGAMVIRWMQGSQPVYSTIAVGSIMPLTRSATGFAFLAHLSRRLTEPMLKGDADAAAARKSAALVRRRGYATVANGLVPGLSAIAGPVLDPSGDPVGVITAVASRRRFSEAEIAALKAHARDAMLSLGAEPA